MKKRNKARIVSITIIVVLFTTIYCSCKKDGGNSKCQNVVCKNGGKCDTGVCICPSGYSGINCETGFVITSNDINTQGNVNSTNSCLSASIRHDTIFISTYQCSGGIKPPFTLSICFDTNTHTMNAGYSYYGGISKAYFTQVGSVTIKSDTVNFIKTAYYTMDVYYSPGGYIAYTSITGTITNLKY